MDWSTSTPLGAIKERLAWLGERQQVLARNIANADTPDYRPRDLEPLRFGDLTRRAMLSSELAVTDPGHIRPASDPAPRFSERAQRDAADTTPAGNAVDLEEQMAKVNETAISHKLATQLYRKYLGLVRMAASARG